MVQNEFKPEHFAREDGGDDELFYLQPRLVKHIDEPACVALADYYARTLPTGSDILDLMSSYASHLPAHHAHRRVVGLGMNLRELEANQQLSERHVHNLNTHPVMPFADGSFDACILAVSVQYLTRPIEVFADVARVLKPGALLAISFSNRMFASKAVAIWRTINDADHARLLQTYLRTAGCYQDLIFEDLSPAPGTSDPIYVVSARREMV
ncbi:MAG: methyltransferase domain-containing protein [Proteobacteria bacterium]|nr:methyltransferase domain-containing protein [Pseudomonadota bacterium]MDA1357617.1 methyltransferase domain-containing protein [Pseudomonadota bacterium]